MVGDMLQREPLDRNGGAIPNRFGHNDIPSTSVSVFRGRMQVVREELESISANRLAPGKTVTDPLMANAILQAMSDEVSRKILSSTIAKAKPVEEISAESNIPPSTAYRRVQELSEMGLMLVERVVISENGKRYSLFRSAFRGLLAELESGQLHVEVTLNEDVADRFYRMRQSIRFG